MKSHRARYRIVAWGSETGEPDLDYEAELYPVGLSLKYRFIDVQLIRWVDIGDIESGLDEAGGC